MPPLDKIFYREKSEISFENELGMMIQNGQAVKLPKRGFNIEKNRTSYTYTTVDSNKILSMQPETVATMYGDDIQPNTYRVHRGFVLLFDKQSEPYLISLANISIDVFLKKLNRHGFISKHYLVPFTDGAVMESNDVLGFHEIIQFAYRERYKIDKMKTEQAKFLNEILNLSYENIFSAYEPTSKTLNFEIIDYHNGSNLILVSDPTGASIVKGDVQTVHRLRKNGYIQRSDENISIKEMLDSHAAYFWLNTQQKIDPEFYQTLLELQNSPLESKEKPQTLLNKAEKEQVNVSEQNNFTVFANLLTLLDRAVGGIGQFLEIKEQITQISKLKENLDKYIGQKQIRLEKAELYGKNGNNEKKKLKVQISNAIDNFKLHKIPIQAEIDIKKQALSTLLSRDQNLISFLNQNEKALASTFELDHVGQIEISRLVDLKLAMITEDWHEVKGSFRLGDDNLVHIQPFNLGYAVIETDSKEGGDPEDIMPTTLKVVFSGEDLIREFVRFGQFIVEGEYRDDLQTVVRSIYPENLAVDRKGIGKSVKVDADILDTMRSPILKKFIQDIVLKLKINTKDLDWSLEIILEPYDKYLETDGSQRVAKIITHYAKENSLTETTNEF